MLQADTRAEGMPLHASLMNDDDINDMVALLIAVGDLLIFIKLWLLQPRS